MEEITPNLKAYWAVVKALKSDVVGLDNPSTNIIFYISVKYPNPSACIRDVADVVRARGTRYSPHPSFFFSRPDVSTSGSALISASNNVDINADADAQIHAEAPQLRMRMKISSTSLTEDFGLRVYHDDPMSFEGRYIITIFDADTMTTSGTGDGLMCSPRYSTTYETLPL
ncbi:hypothetical protein EVAR_58751_1 [Eumeta japonica]|uniref:Uncharacterized protein n=1 Tax=Eumeta variegata TaxID=151549 RepID=A0A4C1ZD79_EUMVA|nr:hypothetical protein EVAR_58751_1 [Eumeta japonica]